MAARGALLLLGSAAGAWAQLVPTGEAPAGWPAATELASNQSWPMGFQPPRLSGWKMDATGRPMTCWQTTVLHDHKKGWPGLCLGLFQVDSVNTEALCKEACWGDPRCSMWQYVTTVQGEPIDPPQCWVGYGRDCDERKGNPESIDIGAAQRLQHGAVHVYRELGKVKIKGLYSFGKFDEGTEALSIQRCRDWCYSSIVCEYWQYSVTDGCFADAPHLTTKHGQAPDVGVEYPLTLRSYVSGTDEANSMLAGQYVQHFCPPQVTTDPGEEDVFYDPNKDVGSAGPPFWVWILTILLLLALIGFCLWYFCVYGKTQSRDHRSLRTTSADDDEEFSKGANFEAEAAPAPKLNETMSSQADSFGPPPAPPPKQASLGSFQQRPPSPTSYRSVPRPTSPTRGSPVNSFQPASVSFTPALPAVATTSSSQVQPWQFQPAQPTQYSVQSPPLLNQGVPYNQPMAMSAQLAYPGQSGRLM